VAEQLTEPQADAVASKLNELEERLDDARLSARINMDTITGMQKAGEPRARAIRSAIEVLEECDDYFDRRADADTIGDPPRVVGNREMHMLTDVRDALEKLRGAIK
jgi:hypothetical protein